MTLDSFLILLSDTAWKLVPVVLVVLLHLCDHRCCVMRSSWQSRPNRRWHTVQDDLKKLDKPLQTVNELSETIDLVHEASRNAVRSVLVTIIENASSIKDWILSKKRTDEERSEQVQEVDSDGR